MSLKSKFLKHISGTQSNSEQWSDLSESDQLIAKKVTALYLFTTFAFTVSGYVSYQEVKNTPLGCTAILFPEQTFTKQPEHCKWESRAT